MARGIFQLDSLNWLGRSESIVFAQRMELLYVLVVASARKVNSDSFATTEKGSESDVEIVPAAQSIKFALTLVPPKA